MITISRNKIPDFLKDGSFYESLDKQDEGEFEIPENCYKESCDIDTFQDLNLLLNTVRFWGLFELPVEVFEFIMENGCVDDYNDLLQEFPELNEYLQNVLAIKNLKPIARIPVALRLKLGHGVVTWLHLNKSAVTTEAAVCAASVNDLESLMYLHAEGCPWDENTVLTAAMHQSLDCLRYALRSGCTIPDNLMNQIAIKGYIDVLKVLHSEGIPWDETTLTAAVQGKNLHCVRFLHENGCSLTNGVCAEAVKGTPIPANLEILRYLHHNGGELSLYTSKCAVLHGNLPCLVYLHTHGCPWNLDAPCFAAGGGYLSCVVYLHTQGCPWDEKTVTLAVGEGHWWCAFYAIIHGCPWYKTGRVLIGFFICICTCYFVAATPDTNWYYKGAKLSVTIFDCFQEVYETFSMVLLVRQIYLGNLGHHTLWDTFVVYLPYVKTPLSLYCCYCYLLYLYNVWLNWK